jgi:tRNA dimethylallyltransferase
MLHQPKKMMDTLTDDAEIPGEAAANPSFQAIEPPKPDELLVIVGPTASGKTELAVRLAESFNGEIINADSVQIYRDYNIGSGKPTAEEQARAPHHLVSIADPRSPIDARGFADLAERAIADIRSRGRTPIVCGGTFLWIKSLVFGLAPAPPASAEIRAKHAEFAAKEGRKALHEKLASVDPESAARLAPNDLVRVSRALEIFELSGKPQSQFFSEHGFRESKHRARFCGVSLSRENLDQRIRDRAQKWLGSGWIEEVTALLAQGHKDSRAMGSVGYKQVHAFVEGELARQELEDAIVRATRVFARRQRTWLRDQPVSYYTLEAT